MTVQSIRADDKSLEPKMNNITGNIIHVTVNNYMGPSSSSSTTQQSSKKMNSDQIYDSILQNYSNMNSKQIKQSDLSPNINTKPVGKVMVKSRMTAPTQHKDKKVQRQQSIKSKTNA